MKLKFVHELENWLQKRLECGSKNPFSRAIIITFSSSNIAPPPFKILGGWGVGWPGPPVPTPLPQNLDLLLLSA